jgi:Helix-turn-helix domain
VGDDRSTPEMARYTVAEAADMLGISTGAIRNRLSRGTLRKVKEGGTVYVLLPSDMSQDAGRDAADTPGGMPHSEPDTLTSELRDRLRYVEEQLEAERQAHAEARRLLMAALERIPPQLEAPSEERESPPTVEEEPERAEPYSATGGAEEGVRRPWWRRVFGR